MADTPDDWQDMNTAPLDGSTILLKHKHGVNEAVYLGRKDIWVSPDGAEGYDPLGWRATPNPMCGHLGRIMDSKCLDCGEVVNPESAAVPHAEPPARVWIDLKKGFYSTLPGNTQDVQYAHLEPIKRAMEKCAEDVSNQLDPDSKYLLVRKSGWKNLCDVIRAGSL